MSGTYPDRLREAALQIRETPDWAPPQKVALGVAELLDYLAASPLTVAAPGLRAIGGELAGAILVDDPKTNTAQADAHATIAGVIEAHRATYLPDSMGCTCGSQWEPAHVADAVTAALHGMEAPTARTDDQLAQLEWARDCYEKGLGQAVGDQIVYLRGVLRITA
jgi:hypothetical protein